MKLALNISNSMIRDDNEEYDDDVDNIKDYMLENFYNISTARSNGLSIAQIKSLFEKKIRHSKVVYELEVNIHPTEECPF